MFFSTLTCSTSQIPGVYERHINQSTIWSSAVLSHIHIYMTRYVTCFVALTTPLINLALHLQKGTPYWWVGRAQSVQQLATGWKVRGSNPGGDEIFRTYPERLWGPPSLLYNGYQVLSLSNEHSSQVKDQGRRQYCHNRHKEISLSAYTWCIYTFRTSLVL